MYTNQTNREIIINKEKINNALGFSNSFLFTIIYFLIFLISIIKIIIPLIVASLIFFIYSFFKFIIQVHLIKSFNKLIKSIKDTRISFYIAKSWKRKYYSNIWIGSLMTIINIILLIITIGIINLINMNFFIISTIILTINFFILILSMYINYLRLNKNLEIMGNKFENFHSIEWREISKEQKIFYKSITIYTLMIIFIIPIILMIIPSYNRIIKNFLKK